MHEQVTARAAELGLDYRFDRALTTNTTAAHRLSHFAAAHGRQHAMVQRLFRAYFTDGLNIGDYDVLADLAADVGLDRAKRSPRLLAASLPMKSRPTSRCHASLESAAFRSLYSTESSRFPARNQSRRFSRCWTPLGRNQRTTSFGPPVTILVGALRPRSTG